MLRSAKEMLGYRVKGADGEFGRMRDLLLDDRTWAVRHMVVDVGTWLVDKLVLLPPPAFETPDHGHRTVSTGLSRAAIENAPAATDDAPVSAQGDAPILVSATGWPLFASVGPTGVADGMRPTGQIPKGADPHLRSAEHMTGYVVHAMDGEIGSIGDLVIDTDAWTVKYVVVATGTWLPGRKVLVAPGWTKAIEWATRQVHVKLTCAQVKGSPTFDPKQPINVEYERRLYDYYGRPREPVAQE